MRFLLPLSLLTLPCQHPQTFDTTSVPVLTRTFITGGVYPMRLLVVDDGGCMSAPSDLLPVLVSPTADFVDHTVPASACAGNTLTLQVDPIQPPMRYVAGALWSQDPPLYLPDDVGNPVLTETIWLVADTGAVITDPAQLGDICLDIEHSSPLVTCISNSPAPTGVA